MSAVLGFLRQQKESLLALVQNGRGTKLPHVVQIVVGNEAFDLDSMVSSIAMAHWLQFRSDKQNTLCYPLIPITRAQMAMRRECVLHLERHGMGNDDMLWFFDDVASDNVSRTIWQRIRAMADCDTAPFELQFVLVDHHELSPALLATHVSPDQAKPSIAMILDHHQVVRDRSSNALGSQPWKCILPVGSCASLVGALYLGKFITDHTKNVNDVPALSKHAESLEFFPACIKQDLIDNADILTPIWASWLLGPITLDTIGLDPKSGRTTQTDLSIAAILFDTLDDLSSKWKANMDYFAHLYETLNDAKFDQSHLSTDALLERDCKQWDIIDDEKRIYYKYRIASICYALDAWIERDGVDMIVNDIDQIMRKESLCICIVMSAYYRGGMKNDFCRDMIVVARDSSIDCPNNGMDIGLPTWWSSMLESIPDMSSGYTLSISPLLAPSYRISPAAIGWIARNLPIKCSRKVLQPSFHTSFSSHLNKKQISHFYSNSASCSLYRIEAHIVFD